MQPCQCSLCPRPLWRITPNPRCSPLSGLIAALSSFLQLDAIAHFESGIPGMFMRSPKFQTSERASKCGTVFWACFCRLVTGRSQARTFFSSPNRKSSPRSSYEAFTVINFCTDTTEVEDGGKKWSRKRTKSGRFRELPTFSGPQKVLPSNSKTRKKAKETAEVSRKKKNYCSLSADVCTGSVMLALAFFLSRKNPLRSTSGQFVLTHTVEGAAVLFILTSSQFGATKM